MVTNSMKYPGTRFTPFQVILKLVVGKEVEEVFHTRYC